MLSVLQLSDIHFNHERDSVFNVRRELQDGLLGFLPQLQDRIGDVGLVVVTGDVAYSGKPRQYETADAFLREVRSRLRDPAMPVRVIPGNHDIFRAATESAEQDNLRSGPRVADLGDEERGDMVSDLLEDAKKGSALMAPLEAYNEFAASFGCRVSRDKPYWDHRSEVGEGWILRLRGMNTVLLSNSTDERDRLVIGGNLQTNAWAKEPGEISMSLAHHPYCWLLDASALSKRVRKRSHLHVTGHVHRHRLDDAHAPEHVHLLAGALQPPRREDAVPRFNGLTFDVQGSAEKPQLELTVTAVMWDEDQDRFVFDEAACTTCRLDLSPQPTPAPAPADDPHLDRLRERLSDLPEGQQLDAASAVGLDVASLLLMELSERPAKIIEGARAKTKLSRLWDGVAELHGGQLAGPNPYKGTGQ